MPGEAKNTNSNKGAKFVVTPAQTILIVAVGIAVFLVVMGDYGRLASKNDVPLASQTVPIDQDIVTPSAGVALPITWGSLGSQMVKEGVIDAEAFEDLYARRGGLDAQSRDMLYGTQNEGIIINPENSGIILNLLWAFGLSNKNRILEEGPMQDEQYGGAQYFASTGGWTLAVGDTMDHYSAHTFVTLTKEQQELVERVAKNIYRPCCGNSTYFPDCNHGMAMLGLLELLAAEGASEDEMYTVALQVNSYWFPGVYYTIATYFEAQGIAWADVDPKLVLGEDYSSAYGFNNVLQAMKPTAPQSGPGCGV
ncbi:hypothetical protein CL652_03150 [bacterium]|nr:hypothetical protein [bacterium]|tara:strand:- start:1044 stop:1970 length:927 start_codon:yes stop_codon:yes gene_type:complete